ncbi:hypothetical protein BFW01_g8609 [Lasiodiplodia theobromae]|nr:hypothetical protein BFW01_g8609 [Lasiodiplodia theobromae]
MAPHVAELLFGVDDIVFYMVLEAFAWSTLLGFAVFLGHVYQSQGLAVHAISFFIFFEYFWVTRFGFGLEWSHYDMIECMQQMARLLLDVLLFLKYRRIAMDMRKEQQNLPPQNHPLPPMLSRRERRQQQREQQREHRREHRRELQRELRRCQGNPSPRIHDDDRISISSTGDNSNDSATNGMRQIRGNDKTSAAVRGRIIRSRHVHKKHYVATDTEAAGLGIKP